MNTRYSTILFDLDDTLMDFPKAEREALRFCLDHYGIPYSDEIYRLYHDINHAMWEALERGELKQSDIQGRRFHRLFAELGKDFDGGEANTRFVEGLCRGVFLLPGAMELCQTLSRYCKLYLITNGIAVTQRARMEGSGLLPYFHGLFISEEMGVGKPHRAYFQQVLDTLEEKERSRILVVGDRLTADIAGAQSVALPCCWCNLSRQENTTAHHPTFEIHTLPQLLDIVLLPETAFTTH